jgi:hypothetical protein
MKTMNDMTASTTAMPNTRRVRKARIWLLSVPSFETIAARSPQDEAALKIPRHEAIARFSSS